MRTEAIQFCSHHEHTFGNAVVLQYTVCFQVSLNLKRMYQKALRELIGMLNLIYNLLDLEDLFRLVLLRIPAYLDISA